jgi:hypothetical protein
MTIEQMVLKNLHGLPPGKQREVLQFVEGLRAGADSKKPLRSLEGFLEDLKVDVTEEDIAQARREMWGSFPRDIA